jgi:hypothetical protein
MFFKNTTFRKLDVSVFREKEGGPYFVGPLRKR